MLAVAANKRRTPAAPSYGPELIVNGDFAGGSTGWSPSGGWSISGGSAAGTDAGSSLLQSSNPLTIGHNYLATFDYTMSAGSKLRIGDGSTNVYVSPALGASGSISASFTATNVAFYIEADSALFTGTVDNVSVKRVL